MDPMGAGIHKWILLSISLVNFPATQPFFGDPLNKLGNVECVQIEVIFSGKLQLFGSHNFWATTNYETFLFNKPACFFLEGSTAQKLPVSREHPKVWVQQQKLLTDYSKLKVDEQPSKPLAGISLTLEVQDQTKNGL